MRLVFLFAAVSLSALAGASGAFAQAFGSEVTGDVPLFAPDVQDLVPPVDGTPAFRFDDLVIPEPAMPREWIETSPSGVGFGTLPAPAEADTAGPTSRRSFSLPSGGLPSEEVPPVGTPAGTRLSISVSFLSELFRRSGCTSGEVRDQVLGADVTGRQQTRSRTTLELVPSPTTAQILVHLDGETATDTVGQTRQADVFIAGRHRFRLTKPITFDGRTLTTRSPSATVWPSQQTNGAVAKIGQRLPVVRRLASRIAYEESLRRAPAASRVSADRVTRQAVAPFNTGVDAGLTRLQDAWSNGALSFLDGLMVSTPTPRASTTTDALSLELPTPTVVPETEPPARWTTAGRSLSLAVHESVVNAALDRLGLGGQPLDVDTFESLSNALFSGAAESAPPPYRADKPVAQLVLEDRDPVSVRFTGGRFEVELRGRISTLLGESPPQRIVIPFGVSVDAQHTHITPGDPVVTAMTVEESPEMMEMVRAGIEDRVSQEVRPLRLPRMIPLPVGGDDEAARTIPLSFDFYRSREGWLVLGWGVSER